LRRAVMQTVISNSMMNQVSMLTDCWNKRIP
jgi:hypothetical protein